MKEGHLEGKSKEVTTLVTNIKVDELIESTLESVLEEMSDRSPPEFQATKNLSQPSSNALSSASVVQPVGDENDENAPSVPTHSTVGQGHYSKGNLLTYKSMKESL